jgi:hypothetical protein
LSALPPAAVEVELCDHRQRERERKRRERASERGESEQPNTSL